MPRLGSQIGAVSSSGEALALVTAAGTQAIENASCAGVTWGRNGRFEALAAGSVQRLERIENLERALAGNRDIGVAMGILMDRHLITRDQALNLLRVAASIPTERSSTSRPASSTWVIWSCRRRTTRRGPAERLTHRST